MIKRLFLFFFLTANTLILFSQAEIIYNSPNDLYKIYTFQLSSTSPIPFKPTIPKISKTDFVYFEVSNNQIDIGLPNGKCYANGLDLTIFEQNKFYKNFNFGSVVCNTGNLNENYGTRKMFVNIWEGIDESIYHAVADKKKMVNDSYVPGNYFVAKNDGELSFRVNDNIPNDNKGSFKITVCIIKFDAHINRNKFNKCPFTAPRQTNENGITDFNWYDCLKKIWTIEGPKSVYYHGFNDAYRGEKNYPGCQCVYTPVSKKLLTKDADEGTFDIALWKFGGNDNADARHLHLIADMLPHDAFRAVKGKNLLYQYYDNTICNLNPCPDSKIKWIKDAKIGKCPFVHPTIPSSKILKVEYGNIIDEKSYSHHCYYTETKICETTDCKDCTEKKVFELMISNKEFIAPPPVDKIPITDCGVTSLFPYSPIITTIHQTEKSIINYTSKIYLTDGTTETHIFHPGKIQRTVFKRGNAVYIGTMGDGNGDWKKTNIFLGENGLWQLVDEGIRKNISCNPANVPTSSTLFLLDVSGSMAENNKWQSSKQSAISALSSIANQTNGSSQTPAISVKTFEGGCVTNPTKNIIDFTTNLSAVEDALKNKIPLPGGGTPLPQAIKIAEDALKAQLKQTNQCKGTLIILTDGQSTCGSIRPQGTYAYTETKQVTVDCNAAPGSFNLKYNTIGFDIPPGSEAERDLQYISSSSGGRYFYAKDSFQLHKAFEKLSRAYIPIEKNQSNARTSEKGKQFFNKAVGFIKSNDFDTAYKMMQLFLTANPADSAAIYNYALMSEATENYKEAISYYSKYIKQNPNNVNNQQIEQQVKKIGQYANEDKEYHLKIIQTDFTYLENSYKKINNKQNIARSNEFTGFIKEKGTYYKSLLKILGSEDASLNSLIKQIADGFFDAERYIAYKSTDWDTNALPVIGLIYLKMQSLIQKIK